MNEDQPTGAMEAQRILPHENRAAKRLHDAFREIEQIVLTHSHTVGSLEKENDRLVGCHNMQMRNTIAFKAESDQLTAKLVRLKTWVLDSDVLRDPTLTGAARSILTELADG